MKRLTKREWQAIGSALGAALAGEALDGVDEGSEEERDLRAAMETAHEKVSERW